MEYTIKRLRKVCDKLLSILNSIPEEKVYVTTFDKWSIKDSVAHINGWNIQRVVDLENILSGEEMKKIDDFDAFNEVSVSERKEYDWSYILKECADSCEKMIESFEKVPGEMFNDPIWTGSSLTIQKLLEIDTNHIEGEHLPLLEKVKN